MRERDFGILGVVLAFAGGALAGAATALLLAPASGLDTRDSIKRFAIDTKDKAVQKAHNVKLPWAKRSDLSSSNGTV